MSPFQDLKLLQCFWALETVREPQVYYRWAEDQGSKRDWGSRHDEKLHLALGESKHSNSHMCEDQAGWPPQPEHLRVLLVLGHMLGFLIHLIVLSSEVISVGGGEDKYSQAVAIVWAIFVYQRVNSIGKYYLLRDLWKFTKFFVLIPLTCVWEN